MRVGGQATGRGRVAAEDRLGDRRADHGHQVVAEGADLGGEALAVLGGVLPRDGEGSDGGHVERPGAHMPLLAAAVQHGHGAVLTAEQERPDAVRPADLVAGDGHRGEPGGAEVDGELAVGLHGVGVQRDAELRGDVGQFVDRLDRADLVVGPHDGGQGDVVGVACDRLAQRVGVDAAVGVDGEVLDGGALVLPEPVDGVEDGVVFDGAGETRVRAGSASRRAQYRPFTARLSASVPPEVKTTSLGRAPSDSARVSRASSTVRRARRPAACSEEALPVTAICAVIAAIASGSIGVVAA